MKFIKKQKAIILRKSGHSLKEIAQNLDISKSTASIWLREIPLSPIAMARLSAKVSVGQMRSAKNKKEKTVRLLDQYYQNACVILAEFNISQEFKRIVCSLIYWCEGGKSDNRMIQFTNSDPNLISGFLALLRTSYEIDEKKFRACLHVHEYHDAEKVLNFWSKITKIPRNQFIKPYLKPNTAKRIRDNYQGCLQVRYYDADIARQVIMLAKAFFDNHRSLV